MAVSAYVAVFRAGVGVLAAFAHAVSATGLSAGAAAAADK
jgi:hypothetical protein